MTLSTSCSTVIVSEQFRHSMMIISIICDMTTNSSFSIQQQYDMSQLWKYDTLPDTDTNVSLCALLYIHTYVWGVHPYLLALLWLVYRALRENTTQNLSLSMFVCVYACVSQRRTQRRPTDAHTGSRLYKLFQCAQSSPHYKTKRY